MTARPLRPDYDGAWIGALVPALQAGGADWLPAAVTGARGVCLLVIDGLGQHALDEHADALPTLCGLEGGTCVGTVPSTTATALTSISTGLPPARHGVLGYRMRVGGEILNVLRWETRGGNAPDPEAVQPHPVFAGVAVPVITRAEFADTGFTKAHLRGTRFTGWRTESGLVEHCRLAVEAGEPLVYAYYDGVDKVAHAHGLEDGFFRAELAAADRLAADLLALLPDDYALVVTADHGQVQVGAEGVVSLDALDPLVAAYAGEGRFRGLHARRGAAADLYAAASELVGHSAWVFSRDELFDEGWFGEGGGPTARGRVGDVVLAAYEPVAFADPGAPGETRLVAYHGSLTTAEMVVPLRAGRGQGTRSGRV
jgi:hypothetical protein